MLSLAFFFLIQHKKCLMLFVFFRFSEVTPITEFSQSWTIGRSAKCHSKAYCVSMQRLSLEFLKWESVKLCKLTQCSFLLKGLILLLEQLSVSVDLLLCLICLLAVVSALRSFKKNQTCKNNYKLCVGCFTLEFQILILYTN